jgi:hypothetical protein
METLEAIYRAAKLAKPNRQASVAELHLVARAACADEPGSGECPARALKCCRAGRSLRSPSRRVNHVSRFSLTAKKVAGFMAHDERRAMRCLMCHAEMILIKVVAEETAGVTGFERRTFQCSNCGDVEQRLTFSSRAIGERAADVPPHHAPPVSPSNAAEQPEDIDSPGLWERTLAKLRGRTED